MRMSSPSSLARCSRQMKQYDVLISSSFSLAYDFFRPLMTAEKVRGPELPGSGLVRPGVDGCEVSATSL